MFKLGTILCFAIIVSCSNGQENEAVDLSALCTGPDVLIELEEPIPAKVAVVDEGQPFFNGVKTYYEVDAETYLPLFFEKNGQKIARIFPLTNIDLSVGKKTEIKGKLSSCLTGAHGLLTNDYKGFIIIEQ